VRTIRPYIERLSEAMAPPTDLKRMADASRWIMEMRELSWSDSRFCDPIDRFTMAWRQWYATIERGIGFAAMRALLLPIDGLPAIYRRVERHARRTPSMDADERGVPLPREDSHEAQMFDHFISDPDRLRHWFANAPDPPTSFTDMFPLMIYMQYVDGFALLRAYRAARIDRRFGGNPEVRGERALIEDFIYVFGFQVPRWRTRQIMRRVVGLGGYLRSFDAAGLAKETYAAMQRLYACGHLAQPRPHVWYQTQNGRGVAHEFVLGQWSAFTYVPPATRGLDSGPGEPEGSFA
jgi:hypothetical protein